METYIENSQIQEKFDDQQVNNIDKDFKIDLSCKTHKTKIIRKNIKQEIPILIELNVEKQQKLLKRQNIDLIVLIDISGSMQGQSITLVKKSIRFLIQQFKENDRLCLITFNKFVKKLNDLVPMNDEKKNELTHLVQDIRTGGSTNIKEAIEKGIQVIMNRDETANIPSIILLTDGMDTCGNPSLKIIKMIQEAEQKLIQKQNCNLDINCFGFGQAHDDKLMMHISDTFKGKFYYVENQKYIDQSLIDCFSDLMSIICQKATIQMFCSQNCRIIKDYSREWVVNKQYLSAQNEINNIVCDMNKKYMLLLEVDPIKENQNNVRLLMIVLKYNRDGKEYQQTQQIVLDIADSEEEIEVNREINTEFMKIKSIDKVEQFSKLLSDGKLKEANELKDNFINRLKNDKYIQPQTIHKINEIFDRQNFQNITMQNAYVHALRRQQYMPGFKNFYQQNQNSRAMTKKLYSFI